MKFFFLFVLVIGPIAAITYESHSHDEGSETPAERIKKALRRPVNLREFQKVCGIRELAASNLARRRPTTVVRKYGATDTPLENWPWMVKINQRNEETDKWELLCGGSLISRRYVLTAAHCFSPIPKAVDDYAVHVFSYGARLNSNQDSEAKRIDGISLHPDYNPYLLYNDIAVVRLRVGLEPPFMPVCLPKPDSLYDDLIDRSVTVIGYGSTYDDDIAEETTTPTTTTEETEKRSRNEFKDSRVKFHTSTRPLVHNERPSYQEESRYDSYNDNNKQSYGGFTPTTEYSTSTTRKPSRATKAPTSRPTARPTQRTTTQRTTTERIFDDQDSSSSAFSSGYADRNSQLTSASSNQNTDSQTYPQRNQPSYTQQETPYYASQIQPQAIYQGANQASQVYGNQQRYRRHISRAGGPPSYSLREATITVIGTPTCSTMYNKTDRQHLNEGIKDTQICAGNPEGGVDSCQGDSGGPLMTQDSTGGWTLVGIVSFGNSCARKGYPGVYSKVIAFNNFIEDAVDFNA